MDTSRPVSLSATETEACARIESAHLAEQLQPEIARRLGGANIPGRTRVPGEVPAALRSFVDEESNFPEGVRFVMSPADIAEMQSFAMLDRKRDQLLARLLFAARNLAQRNIEGTKGRPLTRCRECMALSLFGEKLAHSSACLTGGTLDLIAELVENATQLALYDAAQGGVA